MSTHEDAALRLALRSMLTEEDWWAQWVEDLLVEEAPWHEEDRTRLVQIALDWASSTQPPANVVTLRQSVGEAISREEEAALPSQARLESTHDAFLHSFETSEEPMLAEQDSVVERPAVRPQATAIHDLYGEPDWSALERQARIMEHAPWDVPTTRINQAVAAIKTGAVTLGTPASALAFCKSADGQRKYTVKESGCSCRATHPCYHQTAVELYRLWQDKIAVPSLFPPTKTVEERLATIPSPPPPPQEPHMMPDTPLETPALPERFEEIPETLPERKRDPAPARRTLTAILADLRKPVPEACIAELPGTDKRPPQKYLPWHTVAAILDTYAPGWEGTVVRMEKVGDQCVVTYRLTLHACDGSVSQEDVGQEDEEKDSYGGAAPGALQSAFKRAAARFGLGRQQLYDKQGQTRRFQEWVQAEVVAAWKDLATLVDAQGLSRETITTALLRQAGVTSKRDVPLWAIRQMAETL